MKARIGRTFRFSAAHYLPGHEKCGQTHGHNYRVEVSIVGEVRESGMVVDFGALKDLFKPVIDVVDHTNLNDNLLFLQGSPQPETTAEHLAWWFFRQFQDALKYIEGVYVERVRVYETEDCWAEASTDLEGA